MVVLLLPNSFKLNFQRGEQPAFKELMGDSNLCHIGELSNL